MGATGPFSDLKPARPAMTESAAMFDSACNSEDEAPAQPRLKHAFGYGLYGVFGAFGLAVAVLRRQESTHLLYGEPSTSDVVLALWWLMMPWKTARRPRRKLSRHSNVIDVILVPGRAPSNCFRFSKQRTPRLTRSSSSPQSERRERPAQESPQNPADGGLTLSGD